MTSERLQQIPAAFRDSSVAVVGDLILDRYVWGNASRISQEAPVPVVHVSRESRCSGGAANVARNVVALGGRAMAFGTVGDDAGGQQLCACLEQDGVDVDGVLTCPGQMTTVKTRVIAGSQQVVRIDREQIAELSTAVRTELVQRLRARIEAGQVQAVVLEDYAKGTLSELLVAEVLELCRQYGLMAALDPHPGHALNLAGLRVLTPNRVEALALAGIYASPSRRPLQQDEALLAAARQLLRNWNVELLLITLGSDGMALFRPGSEPVHIPTRAREVFDVSGAGDTVTASFVLALLSGASPAEAAELANCAGGVVVGKVGTASVTATELRQELRRHEA